MSDAARDGSSETGETPMTGRIRAHRTMEVRETNARRPRWSNATRRRSPGSRCAGRTERGRRAGAGHVRASVQLARRVSRRQLVSNMVVHDRATVAGRPAAGGEATTGQGRDSGGRRGDRVRCARRRGRGRDGAANSAGHSSRLSPTQKEVFTLRVAEGLSYKEIAEAVGTTEGAARVHYHNAMRAVKEFLDE